MRCGLSAKLQLSFESRVKKLKTSGDRKSEENQNLHEGFKEKKRGQSAFSEVVILI